jgi:hypothetical protein
MRSLIAVMLASSFVGACGGTPSTSEPTARDALASPQAFAIVPAETSVELDATVDRGDAHETSHVVVPVVSGGVSVVAAGDQLTLRELELVLAPVTGAGVHLVDLRLRLASPVTTADATWSDDGERGGGSVRATLIWSWAIEVDGRTIPLADQRLDDLAIAIGVDRSGGSFDFDGALIADGARWSWADLVFFGDVTVTLHAEQ